MVQLMTMEGSVSNVEVCNLAYIGQFDQLKKLILTDKSLASKTDQVSHHSLSQVQAECCIIMSNVRHWTANIQMSS